MIVTPGPYAPTVTQWVAGTPTTDVYGDEVAAYASRSVKVLAEYPTVSLEADNASGDVITADRTLLLQAPTSVSELDEFTLTDGLRYRVNGAPARYRHPATGTQVTQVSLRRIT